MSTKGQQALRQQKQLRTGQGRCVSQHLFGCSFQKRPASAHLADGYNDFDQLHGRECGQLRRHHLFRAIEQLSHALAVACGLCLRDCQQQFGDVVHGPRLECNYSCRRYSLKSAFGNGLRFGRGCCETKQHWRPQGPEGNGLRCCKNSTCPNVRGLDPSLTKGCSDQSCRSNNDRVEARNGRTQMVAKAGDVSKLFLAYTPVQRHLTKQPEVL